MTVHIKQHHKGKGKRKEKKWGKIGAPHSAKRKKHLARIRKHK